MVGAQVIAVTAEPGKQREFAQFAGTEFHSLELSRSCSELGRDGRAPSCMVQYCVYIYIYIKYIGF